MKRITPSQTRTILFAISLIILLTTFASAEIILSEQPADLYNLGDIINIPLKVATSADISEFLNLNLICNGEETTIHQEYIFLLAGEQITISPRIPLIPEFTKQQTGVCKIKAVMGTETLLTSEFEISNIIIVELDEFASSLKPGESTLVSGVAIKENGQRVNGFVMLNLQEENDSKQTNVLEIIKNGNFVLNLTIPDEKAAGKYLVNLDVYEKDKNKNITNTGISHYNLQIEQVPTSLELVYATKNVEPGTNLEIKTILHDQTGQKIDADSRITLQNTREELVEVIEIKTDKFTEIPIAKNEAAGNWTITGESNGLSAEGKIQILEKADVQVDFINKTIIAKNIGNTPYSKNMLVKVGNKSISMNITLDEGETQKYIVTAPEGIYDVQIISEENSTNINQRVSLTGKAIDVQKANAGILSVVRMSIIWMFIIAILGFVAMTVFKKGYQKTFFGYITRRKNKPVTEPVEQKILLIDSKNPAVLSLSMTGEKQNSSIVCLNIKNTEEIKKSESKTKESLNEIAEFAENLKAATYETNGKIFFILSPIKTKTFHNEKTALKIAQKTKEIITKHNRIYKDQIKAGISLNYGTIISKVENKTLKFMTLGTLISQAKKISNVSDGRILLGEAMKDKLIKYLRTQKNEINGIEFYIITDIKKAEENKKFIKNFVKKLEEDNKKKPRN